MSDDDRFFPPPRPKRESAYRKPTGVPGAGVDAEPKRVVVTRPEPPPEEPPARLPIAVVPTGSDARPMQRSGLFSRYPRLAGAVIALVGGGLALLGIHAVANRDKEYSSVVLGSATLFVGIWVALFGHPSSQGRSPKWWVVGVTASSILGALLGIVVCVGMAF